MQKLQTYFGFSVALGTSITAADFNSQLAAINAAIDSSGIERNKFELYICPIHIKIEKEHFDHSPLPEKLGRLEINLTVNKSHRHDDRIYFLNNRIAHSLTPTLASKLEKFDLRYTVDGNYFEKKDQLHEAVYVAVARDVRRADRKIKVSFLGFPTTKFGGKLINLKSAATKLDLNLDPRIQLRLDI